MYQVREIDDQQNNTLILHNSLYYKWRHTLMIISGQTEFLR